MTVTLTHPVAEKLTNALLTEVLTCLGRVARDAAWAAECGPLADRLGAAMVANAGAKAAGGKSLTGKDGRPGHWMLVEHEQLGERWVRGVATVARMLGKGASSVSVALARSPNKRLNYPHTYDGREYYVMIRKATESEAARLDAARHEDNGEPWPEPAANPKSLARRKKS